MNCLQVRRNIGTTVTLLDHMVRSVSARLPADMADATVPPDDGESQLPPSLCAVSPITRRKISGATHSEDGRKARDAMLGLLKTCRKLGISFWDYLGCRIGVADAPRIPILADILRQPAAA